MEDQFVHRPELRSEHSILQLEICVVSDDLRFLAFFVGSIDIEVECRLSCPVISAGVFAFSNVHAIDIFVLTSFQRQSDQALIADYECACLPIWHKIIANVENQAHSFAAKRRRNDSARVTCF